MKTNGQPNGDPRVPIDTPWNENSAHATGANLALERGMVQFIGRLPLGIKDETMTVPLGVLLTVVGVMLQQMQGMLALARQPTPQGEMLRAIFAAQNIHPGG